MNNKNKTLVILTPAFPADESDSGWVQPVQLFVKKLKENFPALHIIVLTFNYPHHTNTYSWHGITVKTFNGLHAKKLRHLLMWMKVWRELKRIKKSHSISGIFSFWCTECALVGKHFSRRYGIKHYCWISGMDARKENRFVKWIRPRASELIAMSGFLQKEFLKNHGIKPQHIIPIGIDPAEYKEYNGKRDVDILGVGSLIPFKQYDIFIRVIKQLSGSFPLIKAVIFGIGPEQAKLQQLIKELQLENNITLAGVKPHEEIIQWMQRTKVFLHPSFYEGFGLVYLEALYAGAQVVSFTYPLDHAVSRWHVVNNTEEMTKSVHDILQHPPAYTPMLLLTMDESAKAVMKLFDIE